MKRMYAAVIDILASKRHDICDTANVFMSCSLYTQSTHISMYTYETQPSRSEIPF